MKLVHASDLHIGFRAYAKLTAGGINQRESDVAKTFQTFITRVIEVAPDVIVVAGDIFHAVRPTNNSILFAFSELARLVHALPKAIIVCVAGNHDSPRESASGGILQLFANLGIHVVDRSAPRLDFGALSVLCVPDVPGVTRPALEPNPAARFNVLLLHGEVEGMLPGGARQREHTRTDIPKDEIRSDRWDYVALGHYHVYREVAPRMFYSGSIDYTSTNLWGELAEQREAGVPGKGFIEHDLATGAHTFHVLPASRQFADLGVLEVAGLEPSAIDAMIQEAVTSFAGGVDGAVLRMILSNIARETSAGLDHKMIRALKARALHIMIDLRRPDVVRLGNVIGPALMQGKLQGQPLDALVMGRLSTRELAAGVDREELKARAASYLQAANTKADDETAALAQMAS